MTTWHQFAVLQSQFATGVRARFAEATHHVLATLRLDGSPRVSGTEVEFTDTDLTIGSMAAARKADDLLRDPRFALHSNPGDGEPGATGILDAKISGRAVPVQTGTQLATQQEQQPGSHLFRLELDSVVTVGLTEARDGLLIRHWQPASGLVETRRQ